jgi:hypothetical protein
MTRTHPYAALPDRAYWRRAVAEAPLGPDLVAPDFLRLTPDDRIATAGSCFAQHIGRHLAAAEFGYLVTEAAHPIVPADLAREAGYGIFTARYGNIYTTLQLLQLIERAYGRFHPGEAVWEAADGSLVDPYRPTIQPGGFGSVAELEADRAQHLACVREALETLDVFIFTLGLTEAWVSARDGAAFPLCPGVAGGQFDPALHRFHNLRVGEVREQLGSFIERLRAVNPRARVLLTVSPVPLTATAAGGHVLAATTYSKAVLRVAAQEAADELADVHYFPSYEIVTGPQAQGRFYADNLREVTPAGVAQVMAIFLQAVAGVAAPEPADLPDLRPAADPSLAAAAGWVEAMCDEAMLDRPAARG